MKLTFDLRRFCLAFLLFGSLIFLAGCTISWIQEANNIIALIGPMAAAVLSLLAAIGVRVPPDAMTLVTNGLNEVANDLNNVVEPIIKEYEGATVLEQPTILNKLQAALQAAKDQLAGILSALHIKDLAVQEKVSEVVTAVMDEVVLLMELVPVVTAGAQLSDEELDEFHAKLKAVRAKNFKKVFKQALIKPTGDAEIDAATEKIAAELPD